MTHWTLKVKARLQEKQMSYRALAAKIGADPGAVGNWMIGRRTPSRQSLASLAKVLDIPMAELVAEAWAEDEIAVGDAQRTVLRLMKSASAEV